MFYGARCIGIVVDSETGIVVAVHHTMRQAMCH